MNRPVITAKITSFNEKHARISVWNRGGFSGELVVNREDMYIVLNMLKGWIPIEDPTNFVLCPTGEYLRKVTADGSILAIEDLEDYQPYDILVAELPNHVRLCYSNTVIEEIKEEARKNGSE